MIATATQTELAQLLARAQARGLVSPYQASELRAAFTGDRDDLPLDHREAIGGLTDADVSGAALAIMVLLRHKGRHPSELAAIMAGLTLRDILAAHEQAQDSFDRRNRKLAAALLLTGGLLLWHRAMRDSVRRHLAQQFLLGRVGRLPGLVDRERLNRVAARETAYLQRWADSLAVASIQDKLPSRDALAARAALYGGTGRSEFYRTAEGTPTILELLQPVDEGPVAWPKIDHDPRYNKIAVYVANDDDRTCDVCRDIADHPEAYGGKLIDGRACFLVSVGPFPAQLCLGRSRCRCRRDLEINAMVYAMLVSGG